MSIEVEPYANEIQRFYFEELKWCGCANPEEALTFMRDVLQIMHDRSDATRKEPHSIPYEQGAWAAGTKKLHELLPLASPLALSYQYMLCALDLTEHGGSVGGSWLTDHGEKVLTILNSCDIEEAMDDEHSPVV